MASLVITNKESTATQDNVSMRGHFRSREVVNDWSGSKTIAKRQMNVAHVAVMDNI